MLLRVLGPVRPACLDLVGDAAVGSVVSRGAVLRLYCHFRCVPSPSGCTEEDDGFCAAHARLARGRPCKFMQNENLITRSASLLGGHSSGSGSAAPRWNVRRWYSGSDLTSVSPLSRPQRAWMVPP